MLVYAPIPKANYNSFSNNTYFDSIMKSYAPYYNFNETISLIDSLHFYDADHLNQDGVHIFNEKVMEVLKEKKIRRSYQ